MLAPVGNLPPAVYWRRRLLVAGIAFALIVLTGYVLFGGSSDKHGAGANDSHRSTSSTRPATTTSTTTTTSTAAAPPAGGRCVLSALKIAAATDKPSYAVGAQEKLFLVVTNPGTHTCTQDIGDPQVELTIFTGVVRVWGSHDCKVVPGSSLQKLAPGKPLRVEIDWLGKTSQPGCGGTRLQIQPGTYHLYAALAGVKSTPVTFTIKS